MTKKTKKCEPCNGTGRIKTTVGNQPKKSSNMSAVCQACKGKGKVLKEE